MLCLGWVFGWLVFWWVFVVRGGFVVLGVGLFVWVVLVWFGFDGVCGLGLVLCLWV